MPERTAAEVLAEKLKAAFNGMNTGTLDDWFTAAAARLAEDPAITVRTDMVVERFVVEIHRGGPARSYAERTPDAVHRYLTTTGYYADTVNHRIIVRPYPEEAK